MLCSKGRGEEEWKREKGLAGSDGAPGLSRKQLESPDYSVDGHTHTHTIPGTC